MAVEAIGLLASGLGILSFALNNFPSGDEAHSQVRIAVGLDYDGGLDNAGGDLPDVRLFNEVGGFVGMVADPGTIGDGETNDYSVDQDGDSTQQSTYALFSANDDAICIAYASITWPDKNKYAWWGSWGHECGGSWYFSNYFVEGTSEKPDCLWIDANGDQPQTGFQIHWPEFVTKDGNDIPPDDAGKQEKIDYLCNAGPPFTMYTTEDPNTINYWTPNNTMSFNTAYGAPRPRKTSAKFGAPKPKREPKILSHLVVDDQKTRSAHTLCESETSYGPDYVHASEGKFCSMKEKKVYDICSEEKTTDCFDVKEKKLVKEGIDRRAPSPYAGHIDWTEAGMP